MNENHSPRFSLFPHHRRYFLSLFFTAFLLAAVSICLPLRGFAASEDDEAFKDGDIVFQITSFAQSLAIQLATGSQYTHCGIVFKRGDKFFVYEAVQPVGAIPLTNWIKRGKNGHYVLMRLKDRDKHLDAAKLDAMKKAGLALNGKNYDVKFKWSDDDIYCSELIWKIYERGANIRLCPLRTFQDYNLDSLVVRKTIKERYGTSLPANEQVVAPSDLMESPLLERVGGN